MSLLGRPPHTALVGGTGQGTLPQAMHPAVQRQSSTRYVLLGNIVTYNAGFCHLQAWALSEV